MQTLLGNSKIGGLVAAKDGTIVWRWADPARQAAAEARARGDQRSKAPIVPQDQNTAAPDFRDVVADALERQLGRGAHAPVGVQLRFASREQQALVEGIAEAMDRQRGIATEKAYENPPAMISADEIDRVLASRGGESKW
jgi:hypothetical protein